VNDRVQSFFPYLELVISNTKREWGVGGLDPDSQMIEELSKCPKTLNICDKSARARLYKVPWPVINKFWAHREKKGQPLPHATTDSASPPKSGLTRLV
jgi:hypothetical protein